MGYVVVEMQTAADGRVATLCTAYDEMLAAESAYHMALGAAAVSSVPLHAVTLLTVEGSWCEGRCYRHGEVA